MILKYFLFLQEGGLNTSGETEADIPKFITDSNDKTSYVRGKFLGKVSGEHYMSVLCWSLVVFVCHSLERICVA